VRAVAPGFRCVVGGEAGERWFAHVGVASPCVTLALPGARPMKALSASQAVWPALLRMNRLLFRPFVWGAFLKLAAVATITEGMLFSFRFAPSNAWIPDAAGIDLERLRATPGFAFYAALAVIGAILFALLLFTLLAQLRFAVFNCVLRETRELRPGWALYRAQAQRFFVASLWVWIGLLLLVLLALLGLVITVYVVFTARTPEGKLDPGVFLLLFFPCVGIIVLAGIAALAAEVVMHDFILPHMAVEDSTFREAWRAVRQRMWKEKETFLSYFILRVGLPFVVGVVLVIVGWLAGLAMFGILGASAAGFNAMLDDSAGVGAAIGVAMQILFALLGVSAGAMIAACLGGPMAVFVRGFALYFYGSRYKPLGDILEASEPAESLEGV
jgi:hypothetical protein